jgi:predicted ester cyclase
MKKLILLFTLSGMLTSCMTNTTGNGGNDQAAANKARVQAFYDQVINAHNPAVVDSFCTAEFTDHNPDQGHSGKGLDDLKASFKSFFDAYPDLHMTTNMMIANGDTVMSMISMTGTNSGPMMGQPGTNKSVNISGSDIIVLKNGKATDRWGFFEEMKMMKQLGMIPDMPPAPDSSKMNGMKMEKK